MEAIVLVSFCLFGVLQCAADFAPLRSTGTMKLLANGPFLNWVVPTPIGFSQTTYDYNYSYPMCSARQQGANFVCQLQFVATPASNCTAQVVPSPLNLTIADILVPKPVLILVSYINGSTSTYTINVILLPSEDSSIKSITPIDGTLMPTFASSTSSYQLLGITETQPSITSNITIAEGATLTINGMNYTGPDWVITMPSSICVGENFVLTVTAEDGVTQYNYTIVAYLPDLTVPPLNGTVLVDTAYTRFDVPLDLPKQTLDLYDQISIHSDIPVNWIYLADSSTLSDGTVVQLSFLPAPCGSLDYKQHYIDRFNASQIYIYQFPLDTPDNETNTSYIDSNITSLVLAYSQKLRYCWDPSQNVTLYGDVCNPPPGTPAKKISAEVGIAIATTLVIVVIIGVLAVDFVWTKFYGDNGGKELQALEMRETVTRDETIPEKNSTTTRDTGNTIAEDP